MKKMTVACVLILSIILALLRLLAGTRRSDPQRRVALSPWEASVQPSPETRVRAAPRTSGRQVVSDPAFVQWLFSSRRMAWIWLGMRLYLGWQWVHMSLLKLGDPAWMWDGSALREFWLGVVGGVDGRPSLIAFGWYRAFIQALIEGGHHVWFAKLIAMGELAVGIALIVGAFVGVAAVFGALLNWNYLMAGTTSTNPMLLLVAILLIFAWKTAGYWGADRFLLPIVGTPWSSPSPEKPARGPIARPAAGPVR